MERYEGNGLAVYVEGNQAWIYKAFPPVDPGPRWRILPKAGGPYLLPIAKAELVSPSSSMRLAVYDYEQKTGLSDLRDHLTGVKPMEPAAPKGE
jgi:hypothetical protein